MEVVLNWIHPGLLGGAAMSGLAMACLWRMTKRRFGAGSDAMSLRDFRAYQRQQQNQARNADTQA